MLTTTYTVVPFVRDHVGVLRPGAPRRSAVRETALSSAERIAPFYDGVIVLKERSEPAAGRFLEPVLICVVGDVPTALLETMAA